MLCYYLFNDIFKTNSKQILNPTIDYNKTVILNKNINYNHYKKYLNENIYKAVYCVKKYIDNYDIKSLTKIVNDVDFLNVYGLINESKYYKELDILFPSLYDTYLSSDIKIHLKEYIREIQDEILNNILFKLIEYIEFKSIYYFDKDILYTNYVDYIYKHNPIYISDKTLIDVALYQYYKYNEIENEYLIYKTLLIDKFDKFNELDINTFRNDESIKENIDNKIDNFLLLKLLIENYNDNILDWVLYNNLNKSTNFLSSLFKLFCIVFKIDEINAFQLYEYLSYNNIKINKKNIYDYNLKFKNSKEKFIFDLQIIDNFSINNIIDNCNIKFDLKCFQINDNIPYLYKTILNSSPFEEFVEVEYCKTMKLYDKLFNSLKLINLDKNSSKYNHMYLFINGIYTLIDIDKDKNLIVDYLENDIIAYYLDKLLFKYAIPNNFSNFDDLKKYILSLGCINLNHSK